MSDESKFLRDLRRASIKTAVEHLRVIHRLKQGDAAELPVGGRARERRERADAAWTGDLLFDVARLQLNAYNNLLGLSAKYTDRVIDGVRDLLQPTRRTRARRHRRPMTITGVAGEHAEAPHPIEITNRLATPATVSLTVSEFQSAAGGAPFSAAVSFRAVPADRTLEPGEARDFWMTLELDPPFRAGERYQADVFVVMRGRIVEIVGVDVDVRPRP